MSKQINSDVVIVPDVTFSNHAKAFKVEPIIENVVPDKIVTLGEIPLAIHQVGVTSSTTFDGITKDLGPNEEIILDFGKHLVGHLNFEVESVGSPADAPLLLEIRYGEMPIEITADYDSYDGWISKSWLQDEKYHIDVLPHKFTSNRRNSFRYVRLKVVATSEKYRVIFKNINVNYSSAVNQLPPSTHEDELLAKINDVAGQTLRNCMQDVFEDGPKRDRRLWLGDLYLQAQANYYSFNDLNLVKRCLYLFASIPDSDGRMCANLFVKPSVIADDTYLFDYSLHFINTLADFATYGQDMAVINDLYQTAKQQIKFAESHFNEKDLIEERDYWWAFFDWQDDLNKATAAHGLYLFTLKNMIKLALLVEPDFVPWLENRYEQLKASALQYLLNPNTGLFEADGQVSLHSQIWMILAGVVDAKQGRKMLSQASESEDTIKLVTPFAYHFLVEAYLAVGDEQRAINIIKEYWGAMVNLGADTFWELFNPQDLEFSPYGSHLANSYCHAWSCTPLYLIGKYNLK